MSKKSKISRRNAIKTFALGSSTLAFPKMNRMISSNSKNELLKGNINQSVTIILKDIIPPIPRDIIKSLRACFRSEG